MKNSKKIAVVFSGCGYKEGSEITESVSTLIALTQQDADYQVFAPADVMTEAAKIARDKVLPLSELKASQYDGLVFPGGYGAAKVLSDWATKGSKATLLEDVKNSILQFYEAGKPIAAICIAPTLVAKALGSKGVTLTIGNDEATANEIQKTGAIHENCAVTDFISDREHKVISTPAYMYDDAKPSEVFTGISKAIKELVEMS